MGSHPFSPLWLLNPPPLLRRDVIIWGKKEAIACPSLPQSDICNFKELTELNIRLVSLVFPILILAVFSGLHILLQHCFSVLARNKILCVAPKDYTDLPVSEHSFRWLYQWDAGCCVFLWGSILPIFCISGNAIKLVVTMKSAKQWLDYLLAVCSYANMHIIGIFSFWSSVIFAIAKILPL